MWVYDQLFSLFPLLWDERNIELNETELITFEVTQRFTWLSEQKQQKLKYRREKIEWGLTK